MLCMFCKSETQENMTNLMEAAIHCPNCGIYLKNIADNYELRDIFQNEPFKGKEFIFSSYLAELREQNKNYFLVNKDSLKFLLNSGDMPVTIQQRLDRILLRIYQKSKYLLEDIPFDIEQYGSHYAQNQQEYFNMINTLCDMGFLESGILSYTVHVTLEGIKYVEENQIKPNLSNKCFVAMWFDQEMIAAFNRTIKPVVDSCGFETIIIPMVEHNDSINDRIISEIRKSKFVIADFTGNRGGVYFESGFAMGLGKPVIWTCRKDHFNHKITKLVKAMSVEKIETEVYVEDRRDIHFDISHYNFIVWENEDDLSIKLKDRIEATINY